MPQETREKHGIHPAGGPRQAYFTQKCTHRVWSDRRPGVRTSLPFSRRCGGIPACGCCVVYGNMRITGPTEAAKLSHTIYKKIVRIGETLKFLCTGTTTTKTAHTCFVLLQETTRYGIIMTYLGLVEAISLGPQEGRHRRRIFHVQTALRVLLRTAHEEDPRHTNENQK